jgi:hypothetical protein
MQCRPLRQQRAGKRAGGLSGAHVVADDAFRGVVPYDDFPSAPGAYSDFIQLVRIAREGPRRQGAWGEEPELAFHGRGLHGDIRSHGGRRAIRWDVNGGAVL